MTFNRHEPPAYIQSCYKVEKVPISGPNMQSYQCSTFQYRNRNSKFPKWRSNFHHRKSANACSRNGQYNAQNSFEINPFYHQYNVNCYAPQHSSLSAKRQGNNFDNLKQIDSDNVHFVNNKQKIYKNHNKKIEISDEAKNLNSFEKSPKSGEKLPTIYESNEAATADPILPEPAALMYFKAEIRFPDHDAIGISLMCDTGSSISVANINTLLSLPLEIQKHLPIKDVENVDLLAAGGASPITELLTLPLTISAKNQSISFKHKFLISDSVPHEFLVGNDLLGPLKAKISVHDNITFKIGHKDNFQLADFKTKFRPRPNATMKLPVFPGPNASSPCLVATEDVTIEPQKSNIIVCRLAQAGQIPLDSDFACISHPDTAITVVEKLLRNTAFKGHDIMAINSTMHPIKISCGDIVAGIEDMEGATLHKIPQKHICEAMLLSAFAPCENNSPLLPKNKTYECFPVNYFKKTLKAHRKKIATKMAEEELKNDHSLNDEERAVLHKQFQEKGYFPQSVSHMIDKSDKLMELMPTGLDEALTDDQIVNMVKVDHLPEHQKVKVRNLVRSYIDIFANNDFMTKRTNLIEGYVTLKPGAEKKTYISRRIPTSPHLKEALDSYIEKLLKYGVVQRADNKTAFCLLNVFAVEKESLSSDTKIRLVCDARVTNALSQPLQVSNLTKPELWESLCGKGLVSTLDVGMAFYHINLKKSDRGWFTFENSKRERFQFCRMIQGFSGSPAFLSALMQIILQNIEGSQCYADDVILATPVEGPDDGFDYHLSQLEKIFQRLREGNICIKPTKLNINRPCVSLLGYTYRNDGTISIPQLKVQAYLDFPVPSGPKQLTAYLASMNYFRDSIPNFSSITAKLYDIAKVHPKQFRMTPKHVEALNAIKKAVRDAPPCFPANIRDTFYIQCDSSETAAGALLFQRGNTPNTRKLIGCFSKLFSTKERAKYSIVKKEACCLMLALSHWDYLLRYAPEIVAFTDSRAITMLKVCRGSNSLFNRFCFMLSNYNIRIIHIDSKSNFNADILSRPNLNDNEFNTNKRKNYMKEKEYLEWIASLADPPKFTPISADLVRRLITSDGLQSFKKPYTNNLKPSKAVYTQESFGPNKVPRRKLTVPKNVIQFNRRERKYTNRPNNQHRPPAQYQTNTLDIFSPYEFTSNDLFLNSKLVTKGILEEEEFIEAQQLDDDIQQILSQNPLPSSFKLKNGVLIKVIKGNEKLVMPKSLFITKMNYYHHSYYGNHAPFGVIKKHIQRDYYIKNLDNLLKQYTNSCYLCYKGKPSKTKQHVYSKIPLPTRARQIIYFDIAAAVPESRQWKYIYVFTDIFNNFTTLVKAKSRNAEELLEAFKEHVIRVFGSPEILVSDGESGIATSHIFNDFCDQHNIAIRITASHCPFSNGQSENSVKKIKQAIRIYTNQCKTDWDQTLYMLQNALNSQILSYSNWSAEELMFGFSNINKGDFLRLSTPVKDLESYITALKGIMQERAEITRKIREKRNENSRNYVNRTRRRHSFEENQIVFYRDQTLAAQNAIRFKYNGPATILRILDDQNCCQIKDLATGSQKKVHFSQLKGVRSKLMPFGIRPDNKALRLIAANNKRKQSNRIETKASNNFQTSSAIEPGEHRYNLRSKN